MIDIEKAIENINDFIEVWELEQADEYTEMIISKEDIDTFKIAISALEKQIPQMGIPCNSYKNHNFVECGACNRDMGMYYQYCPHCGKKAKWRDKYE